MNSTGRTFTTSRLAHDSISRERRERFSRIDRWTALFVGTHAARVFTACTALVLQHVDWTNPSRGLRICGAAFVFCSTYTGLLVASAPICRAYRSSFIDVLTASFFLGCMAVFFGIGSLGEPSFETLVVCATISIVPLSLPLVYELASGPPIEGAWAQIILAEVGLSTLVLAILFMLIRRDAHRDQPST